MVYHLKLTKRAGKLYSVSVARLFIFPFSLIWSDVYNGWSFQEVAYPSNILNETPSQRFFIVQYKNHKECQFFSPQLSYLHLCSLAHLVRTDWNFHEPRFQNFSYILGKIMEVVCLESWKSSFKFKRSNNFKRYRNTVSNTISNYWGKWNGKLKKYIKRTSTHYKTERKNSLRVKDLFVEGQRNNTHF